MRADATGLGLPFLAARKVAKIRGRFFLVNSMRSGCAIRHFAAHEFPQNLLLSLFFLPDERNVNSIPHCRHCFVTVLCSPFFWHSREQWTCFCPCFPLVPGTNSFLHVGQTFKRVLLSKFSRLNISFLLRPNLVVGGTFKYASLMNYANHGRGLGIIKPPCYRHPLDLICR